MNVLEVLKEENVGKEYIIMNSSTGIDVNFKVIMNNGLKLVNKYGYELGKAETLEEITKMVFKEVIDWKKIPIDTKILVRNSSDSSWERRFFAKYENNMIYAWQSGRCSFTKYDDNDVLTWNYAKLYKEN